MVNPLKRGSPASGPGTVAKRPRLWDQEVDDERFFNLTRRIEKIEKNQRRIFQELASLKERRCPYCQDEIGSTILRGDEELTPVIDDVDVEDLPVIDPRLIKLFQGVEFPTHELKLLKSQDEFHNKVARESERIARQVAEDDKNKNLTRYTSQYESSMQKPGFLIPDDVQTNGAVFATLQGTRHAANEDRYASFTFHGDSPASVHAIFDGHGGSAASEFCARELKQTLQACWTQFVKDGKDYEIANALTVACVKLDADMRSSHQPLSRPGTTACISLQIDHRLFIAYVGDSPAVLCTSDPQDAQKLTYDFKASDEYAQKTVFNRGGDIIKNRVGHKGRGSLAITRALGDDYLRGRDGKKVISPRSKTMLVDLRKLKRGKCTLLVMSDGASDVANLKAMARQTNRLRGEGKSPLEIAKAHVAAAQKAGSKDDITVGVIPL